MPSRSRPDDILDSLASFLNDHFGTSLFPVPLDGLCLSVALAFASMPSRRCPDRDRAASLAPFPASPVGALTPCITQPFHFSAWVSARAQRSDFSKEVTDMRQGREESPRTKYRPPPGLVQMDTFLKRRLTGLLLFPFCSVSLFLRLIV